MKTMERMGTLLALAECASFTEAAKRLYCSQSTISKHIRQLEDYFGAPLLERDGKSVRLTAAGRIALECARETTRLLDEAREQVRHALRQRKRILSVYVSQYISCYHLPEIVTQYHRLFPEQLLEIHAFNYADLRRFMLEGKTNFALLPLYPADDRLFAEFEPDVLFREELIPVMPADHPWAGRKRLYMRDLNRQTILLPQSAYISQALEEHLKRHGVKVQGLQMSNFQLILQAVKARLGMAFLPYQVVKDELERGELASVPTASAPLTRGNGLLIRRGCELTEAERAFIREVKSYFARRLPAEKRQPTSV